MRIQKVSVLLSSVMLGVSAVVPAAASANANPTHSSFLPHAGVCMQIPLPVSLAPHQPAKQNVSSTLCYPFKPDRSRTLDVLLHGASYDRTYWDSAFDYPQYSYVERTLQAGRAVFYYDRLGVGKSTPLPSTSVTMDADAYVAHQIIQHFKPIFPTVDLIGHSYGARIAVLETSQYNDATRLIVTDNLHGVVGPAIVNNELVDYPANQDPLFAGQNLDDGWITDLPGERGAFYYLPGADPNEIAYDDAHRAIVSQTEFDQGQAIGRVPAGSNVTNKITRPVLLVVGQEDALYCGLALDCTNPTNVLNNEKPYYTSAASLDARTIPNTGHDIALHLSAQDSFNTINAWIGQ